MEIQPRCNQCVTEVVIRGNCPDVTFDLEQCPSRGSGIVLQCAYQVVGLVTMNSCLKPEFDDLLVACEFDGTARKHCQQVYGLHPLFVCNPCASCRSRIGQALTGRSNGLG